MDRSSGVVRERERKLDAEKERKGKARTVGKTMRIRKGKVGKQGGAEDGNARMGNK